MLAAFVVLLLCVVGGLLVFCKTSEKHKEAEAFK